MLNHYIKCYIWIISFNLNNKPEIGSTVSPWLIAYLSVLSTDQEDLLLMLRNDDNS